MCLYIDTSFGDRRFQNPAIACVFEFFNSPKPTLFKIQPLLPPQQRRATHPQMAQDMLIRVRVKPGVRLVGLQKNREGTEKKEQKRNLERA
jgi:hypothetical protein